MKKIKVMVLILIVSGLFSYISIFAESNSIAYLGKTLSVYKSYVDFGTQYKLDRTVGQSYYNGGNLNNCTENENDIMVKISCVGQSINTQTISADSTKSWNTTEAKICTRYNLQVRNNVFTPCQSTHSGIWYHN